MPDPIPPAPPVPPPREPLISPTGTSLTTHGYVLGPFSGFNTRGKLSLTSKYIGTDVVVEQGFGTEATYIPFGFNGTYAWDQQFTKVPVLTHAVLRSPNISLGGETSTYVKGGLIDVVEYVTCGAATTDGMGPTTAYGGNYWVPRNFYIPGALVGVTTEVGGVTLTGEAMGLTESFVDSGNYYINGRFIASAFDGKGSIDVSAGTNRTDTDEGDGTSYTGAKNHLIVAANGSFGPVTTTVTTNYWHSGKQDPIKQYSLEVIPQVNVSVPFADHFSFDGNVAHAVSTTHQEFSSVSILDQEVDATSSGWDEDVPGAATIDKDGLSSLDNQTVLRAGVSVNLPQIGAFGQKVTLAGTMMTDWNTGAPLFSNESTLFGGMLVYKGSFQ